MPKFNVRTYEENVEVTSDTVDYVDGTRLMFKNGAVTVAAFSRYLWVKQLDPVVTAPASDIPAPQQQPEEPPATAPSDAV